MQSLFIKDKSFYKTVAKIAVPIALQGLITSGVNMMDTIMIGAVGETELSAVSLANQFINIFHIFCMGIASLYVFPAIVNKIIKSSYKLWFRRSQVFLVTPIACR